MRILKFTIGLTLLILTTLVAKSSFASIGEVTLHKGNAVVDRQDGDKGIEVEKDLDIFSYDTVKTGNGKVGIEFIDQTRVDVTEHSKLLIDEFIYDPNTKTGSLSQLGNNIIVDEPISSIVIAKSVPLTAIVAVGVLIFTFCFEFFAI